MPALLFAVILTLKRSFRALNLPQARLQLRLHPERLQQTVTDLTKRHAGLYAAESLLMCDTETKSKHANQMVVSKNVLNSFVLQMFVV